MLREFLTQVKGIQDEILSLHELAKIDQMNERICYLETKFNNTSWKDHNPEELQEYARLKQKYDKYYGITYLYDDLLLLTNCAIDDGEDPDWILPDLRMDYDYIVKEIQEMKLAAMFTGKYDACDVILNIHAGAGGKEAQDWCLMLLKMYSGWCAKHDFQMNILDWQEGEDNSVLKSVSIEIKGENVYGLLSAETGVHRLVRVSPFDSQNRRHTSFAAVEVMPIIEQDPSVVIDIKDVRVDTFRSSGKGGQHVNKTESAVRLTHIPSGVVVACQQERSQHQNKEKALKMLLAKLVAIKEKEHYDTLSEINGDKGKIEWGNQIRSYVFMPYQMVKDHRTEYQTSNIDLVMSGNIDDFIFKSLAQ